MKKQKKIRKPKKSFSLKEDDFDDLSKKALSGDIKSMMIFLAKHGNRGYELSKSDLTNISSSEYR